jgi:ABC-2 type transport system permease protein
MLFKQKLKTVWTFFVINLRRVFRDKMALFFTFAFPLIFLFVFGFIFGNNNSSVSFKVALINHSDSQFAQQFVKDAEKKGNALKVDDTVKTLKDAKTQMSRGGLDAAIVLPKNFGEVKNGKFPSGQLVVHYTQNNQQAAQTLVTILQGEFRGINAKLVKSPTPFTVKSVKTKQHGLTAFDFTFTGLIGFAILGTSIFGPMNVFPELKKMGILRRLHTTPLRVWQYFVSTMMGYAATGLMAIALMFIVGITVFHLHVIGNYAELFVFILFGIVMMTGIGLALGGWAKNERQAAPLGNIIVFPLMFLTGVFIPRFLMPHWLQHITFYMPLTPVIDGTRQIITQNQHLIHLGPQLGVMAAWLIIIYAIAFRVFRWE